MRPVWKTHDSRTARRRWTIRLKAHGSYCSGYIPNCTSLVPGLHKSQTYVGEVYSYFSIILFTRKGLVQYSKIHTYLRNKVHSIFDKRVLHVEYQNIHPIVGITVYNLMLGDLHIFPWHFFLKINEPAIMKKTLISELWKCDQILCCLCLKLNYCLWYLAAYTQTFLNILKNIDRLRVKL